MLTSLRKLATFRIAVVLLLFVAMRTLTPPMTMPSDSADGFVVVMCSTSGVQATAPAPDMPDPLAHTACDDHCRLVFGVALALIAVLVAAAPINTARTTARSIPPVHRVATRMVWGQSARAPPVLG